MLTQLKPDWLGAEIFGHSVEKFLISILTFLTAWLIIHVIVKYFSRVLIRVTSDKALKGQIELTRLKIKLWFYFVVALFFAKQGFHFPKKFDFLLNVSLATLILIQFLILASSWIQFFFSKTSFSKTSDGQVRAISQSLASITILAIWFLSFLVLLDNFGFNVGTILAGLGVGGIAVGLALQSVLGDVFASFVIGLDQPFELGDFIIIGEFMGTVEKVGLKTTRIRSLGGELLVFANNDLVGSRIRNYKKMYDRRVLFRFGVTYDTEQEQLEMIPNVVRDIIGSVEKTRFDRAHFATFGASSLDFEVVYYVQSPDYNVYMTIQQEINFKLRRELMSRNVSFAFPTTTLDVPDTTIEKWSSVRKTLTTTADPITEDSLA